MAATFLGITGNWGIPQDEAGILINDLSFDFSNQEKPVLDKGGEIIGLSLYQEKVEIKLSGLVAKTSPFSGKIGAALTLANAFPAHLQAAPGGTTILMQISRSLNNEDFEKIDLTATHYPFLATGGA
ncbi:MAG: hypothetical protein K9N23_16535 [Akkermansiaceae bacterium]|nr:hypothetical protein [Akkermansiaceae bacterium]MCF7733299.1 hypothetical protein [Akkermansiaceae bacterium]